jgi:hypothetical protein
MLEELDVNHSDVATGTEGRKVYIHHGELSEVDAEAIITLVSSEGPGHWFAGVNAHAAIHAECPAAFETLEGLFAEGKLVPGEAIIIEPAGSFDCIIFVVEAKDTSLSELVQIGLNEAVALRCARVVIPELRTLSTGWRVSANARTGVIELAKGVAEFLSELDEESDIPLKKGIIFVSRNEAVLQQFTIALNS